MADLRDQLLKAGLIDKAKKQQADTSDRRKRKRKKKKKKKDRAGPDAEALRREAWEKKVAAEAEENRAREAARREEQEIHERQNRLANLVRSGALRQWKPGDQRFCFVSRDKRIQWLYVNAEIASKLELGALAIVDKPGDDDEPYVLVPRDVAERITALDPKGIRFWNQDGSD